MQGNRLTLGKQQSKMLIPSTNVDQKSLETEFLIAICRPNGDKWQSKTLFLVIFDPCLLIVKSICDCRLQTTKMQISLLLHLLLLDFMLLCSSPGQAWLSS